MNKVRILATDPDFLKDGIGVTESVIEDLIKN